MFDFGGMKRDMRSFRKLEPTEGYPVNSISWSPSGQALSHKLICRLTAAVRRPMCPAVNVRWLCSVQHSLLGSHVGVY